MKDPNRVVWALLTLEVAGKHLSGLMLEMRVFDSLEALWTSSRRYQILLTGRKKDIRIIYHLLDLWTAVTISGQLYNCLSDKQLDYVLLGLILDSQTIEVASPSATQDQSELFISQYMVECFPISISKQISII